MKKYNEYCSLYFFIVDLFPPPVGIAERKERDKTERRQSVLDAAQRLFIEQGFEKVRMRNIADAIEYSLATIYLYFKGKNELMFAL